MGDILGNGLSWLASKLEEVASVSVTYIHAGTTRADIPAVFGTSDYKILSELGVETGASRVDFIIRDSCLGFTPTLGDQIVTGGRVYRVVDHGADGCWNWTDGYCLTRRIHTEYTGADV